MSFDSENAVPTKDRPKGAPGAGYTVSGPAERVGVLSGKKPRGTAMDRTIMVRSKIRNYQVMK